MECYFDSCNLKSRTAGLCSGHYAQKRKGIELKKLYNHMSLQERIEEHIKIVGDCWLWEHRLDSRGYPQMKYQGGQKLVHRAYYECVVRPLANNETLDHECRNRSCINPKHLSPLSARENIKRMHLAKYYESEIARLRAMLEKHGYNPDEG